MRLVAYSNWGIEISYRAGTFHIQGTIYHVIDHLLNTFLLFRVMAIVHDARVEVAVANVAENTGKKAKVIEFFLRDFCDC